MNTPAINHTSIKFLITSSAFLFIGTVHGVLQVLQPVRQWLDSIGSPYGGPGHMIDPLAHAHINVVGGVVLFLMGTTYYLLPKMSGKPMYSEKLISHTYWWTTLGVAGFYTTLITFGVLEGNALLNDGDIQSIHQYYGPTISVVATAMGMGFWVFFANLFLTWRRVYKNP